MFLLGALTALSILLIIWKLPRANRRILGHPVASDITLSIGVLVIGLLSLTFSGMMVGVIAGLILSTYLLVGRKLLPSERYDWHEKEWIETKPKLLPQLSMPRIELAELVDEDDDIEPITYKEAMRRLDRR